MGCTTEKNIGCCCCDPCTHDKINCAGDCCKCVPRLLCMSFVPDTPTNTCFALNQLLSHRGAGSYDGSLADIGLSPPNVSINLFFDEYENTCYWEVKVDGISYIEFFHIDGYAYTCHAPFFTISITGACAGTLTIYPYDLERAPFSSLKGSSPEDFGETTITPTCGDFSTVCKVICVQFESGGDQVRRNFSWNATSRAWEAPRPNTASDVDSIILQENCAGNCVLGVAILELFPAKFGEIPITASGFGMVIEAVADTGIEIKISCNPCSCYSYICGTCRCACPSLCVLLYQDNVAYTFELAWNGRYWGTSYDDWNISLDKDRDGNCVAIVEGPSIGYGFAPIPIDTCGEDLVFSGEGIDLNEYGESRELIFVTCKKCASTCTWEPIKCCNTSTVDELPIVLYATITNISDCSCAVQVIPLLFIPNLRGGIPFWRSATTPLGCEEATIQISLPCGFSDAVVTVCCDFFRPRNAGTSMTCVEHTLSADLGTKTCEPLFLDFPNILLDTACCNDEPIINHPGGGGAAGVIHISISE